MNKGFLKGGRATATPPVVKVLLTAALLGAPTFSMADAVTDWNAFVDTLPGQPPPVRTRIQAMMQIAVHDALNAIAPRYESYTAMTSGNALASPEAAVAAASYHVLKDTIPAQVSAITDRFNATIATCATQACLDGFAIGAAAAQAILAARVGDGSLTPHLPYTSPATPGRYQPTGTAPQFAGWALVTPFVLDGAAQFRADPSVLFNLNSEEYTRDYNEVQRVGAADAEINGDRTQDQSEIARFWPAAGLNWNAVTRRLVADRGLDAWEHARLFAVLNVGLADAVISVFDTRYTYNFWRPVTAIRAGDTDGNPQTIGDSQWTSYQATPPYPDYTCGLTTMSGAATEVLRRYFGTDELPYTFTAAGLERSFATLSAAAAESVDARVFGGMHFRTGCKRGVTQGEQVGRFVIQHSMRPVGRNK